MACSLRLPFFLTPQTSSRLGFLRIGQESLEKFLESSIESAAGKKSFVMTWVTATSEGGFRSLKIRKALATDVIELPGDGWTYHSLGVRGSVESGNPSGDS